jgi:hypothetical protein
MRYWLAPSGMLAALFDFFFFAFFTCFSVGAEYELTALDPAGAAGCACDSGAMAASDNAVNISVSFFIRFSPLTVASR